MKQLLVCIFLMGTPKSLFMAIEYGIAEWNKNNKDKPMEIYIQYAVEDFLAQKFMWGALKFPNCNDEIIEVFNKIKEGTK